jgi:hypothetical protein
MSERRYFSLRDCRYLSPLALRAEGPGELGDARCEPHVGSPLRERNGSPITPALSAPPTERESASDSGSH